MAQVSVTSKEKGLQRAEKFNEKVAKLTNEHNDKLDQADKDNYYAMRDFSHETNMQKWQRGAEIQDFNYLNSLKQYQRA